MMPIERTSNSTKRLYSSSKASLSFSWSSRSCQQRSLRRMQPRWTECNPDASDIVVAHGLLRQQVEENLDVDGAVERQDGDKVLVDTVRRLAPLLHRRRNSVRQIELLAMHSSNGRNDSDDHDGAMTASQRSQHEATEATARPMTRADRTLSVASSCSLIAAISAISFSSIAFSSSPNSAPPPATSQAHFVSWQPRLGDRSDQKMG